MDCKNLVSFNDNSIVFAHMMTFKNSSSMLLLKTREGKNQKEKKSKTHFGNWFCQLPETTAHIFILATLANVLTKLWRHNTSDESCFLLKYTLCFATLIFGIAVLEWFLFSACFEYFWRDVKSLTLNIAFRKCHVHFELCDFSRTL